MVFTIRNKHPKINTFLLFEILHIIKINYSPNLCSMDNSIFLAQVLGPLFSILGISLLVHENSMKKILKNLEENPFLIFLSGTIALFSWLIIILSVGDNNYLFEKVLLLLGFIGFFKGIMLLVFPKIWKKSEKHFSLLYKYTSLLAMIPILLGVYLCIVGFSF